MSYSAAMTAIGVHLVAAGTAVAPKIADVQRGAPVSVPSPLIRYWYAGTSTPAHYGGSTTLGTRMVGHRVTVAAYWPVSGDRLALAELDARIQALQDQIYTRLLGDSTLGDACDDLDVGDADVDYPNVNGQQVAELTIPLTLDFGEAYTIAP